MVITLPNDLLNTLLAGERFLIFTHCRPDGDAIGSSFGLKTFLQDNGKYADVVMPDSPPARYSKFGLDHLQSADPADYDRIVILDCASKERIAHGSSLTEETFSGDMVFSLDHHITNNVNARFSFVEAKASSASEIVSALAFQSGLKVTARAAEFWLSGMLTDTGGFKFSNTTGDVLRSAAKLIDCGVDLEKLINILFFSKPARQLAFESDLASNYLKITCGGRFAYALIPPELLEKHSFSLKEDEGIIDILREIDGTVIAMLIHKAPDGFKVSLRSKDPKYPVSPIASSFGGGGHLMAAGVTLNVPDFQTAEKVMLPKVSELLGEC